MEAATDLMEVKVTHVSGQAGQRLSPWTADSDQKGMRPGLFDDTRDSTHVLYGESANKNRAISEEKLLVFQTWHLLRVNWRLFEKTQKFSTLTKKCKTGSTFHEIRLLLPRTIGVIVLWGL